MYSHCVFLYRGIMEQNIEEFVQLAVIYFLKFQFI